MARKPKRFAKKAKKPKKKADGYKRPPHIPAGEVIGSLTQWKIGPSIGVGGFGDIYAAYQLRQGESAPEDVSEYPYVVKIEPVENGPLFVEMHFYNRNYDPSAIQQFMRSRNLSQLGMPTYYGSGTHNFNGQELRYLVMDRYGTDLWKIFKEGGRKFPIPTVFQLGLQMLDVLEYVHGRSYIHADIKGANILLGRKEGSENQAYLLDFGLAYRIVEDNYKPDKKNAHEGTIEYTSTDRHIGAKTMRGDLEILGYNLVHWASGSLPWEPVLEDPAEVHRRKARFMADVRAALADHCPGLPEALIKFFEYIKTLEPGDRPDYARCRPLFERYLESVGRTRLSPLELPTVSLDESATGNKSPQEIVNDESNEIKQRQKKVSKKKYTERPNESEPKKKKFKATETSEKENQNELDDELNKLAKSKTKKKGASSKVLPIENEAETEETEIFQEQKIKNKKKSKKKRDNETSNDLPPAEDDSTNEQIYQDEEQEVTKNERKKHKNNKKSKQEPYEESETSYDAQTIKPTNKRNKRKRDKGFEDAETFENVVDYNSDDDQKQRKTKKNKKKGNHNNITEIDANGDCIETRLIKPKKKKNVVGSESTEEYDSEDDTLANYKTTKNNKRRTNNIPPAEIDAEQSDNNQRVRPKRNIERINYAPPPSDNEEEEQPAKRSSRGNNKKFKNADGSDEKEESVGWKKKRYAKNKYEYDGSYSTKKKLKIM